MMLAAIIAMWASTVAYWIATLLAAVETYSFMQNIMSQIMDMIEMMQDCVDAPSYPLVPFTACAAKPLADLSDYSKAYATQQCTGTAALTVNVSASVYFIQYRALNSALSGNHRRRNCLVARMGTLERPPPCSVHLGHTDTGHYGYAFHPFVSFLAHLLIHLTTWQ